MDESVQLIKEYKAAAWRATMEDKQKEEWKKYLICDGLPEPSNVPEMNTYLYRWSFEKDHVDPKRATHRTDEVIKLLEELQDYIDDPFDAPKRKQDDWLWIRSMFRDYQEDNLNFCTYRLLGDIETKLNRLDLHTADFRLKEKNFSLCLWALVQLPVANYNPRTPQRPRLEMQWPEMSMNVFFPQSLDANKLALRALYVRYDHLSDTSASYYAPMIAELFNKGLDEFIAEEVPPKPPIIQEHENGTSVKVPATTEVQSDPGVPRNKMGLNSSEIVTRGAKAMEDNRKNMLTVVPDSVINLRKYFIIGGVYYIDLFHQPQQPQGMVSYNIFNTTVLVPDCIQEAQFYVEYKPPTAPGPGVRRTPEEIEEEMIKQEKEFDKLIFVDMMLPTHVMWLDAPMVCHWDKKNKRWTTADIYDFKNIEEKGMVTFRTGKFGPFAIATYRYSNLPYQAWEIRPNSDGSVTLQITAAILLIEFTIKGHTVCISQLQNAPNAALDPYINVPYTLPKLIRIMRNCGVDFFPWFDTFCYVDGPSEKLWPMEKHTYYNMAAASFVYNFSWSRWNIMADYRNMVMQMRIHRFDKPKQFNYSMCLVTPLKACYIECTEVSAIFDETPTADMKFYPDLNALVKFTTPMLLRSKIFDAPKDMVNTLAELFISTKFLSFS